MRWQLTATGKVQDATNEQQVAKAYTAIMGCLEGMFNKMNKTSSGVTLVSKPGMLPALKVFPCQWKKGQRHWTVWVSGLGDLASGRPRRRSRYGWRTIGGGTLGGGGVDEEDEDEEGEGGGAAAGSSGDGGGATSNGVATAASGVPLAVQRLEAQLPGVALLKRGLAASKALLEGRNPFANVPWGWGGEDEESIPGANVPAPPPADAQALAEEQRAARYSARWAGDPSSGRSAASGGVSPQWGRTAAAKARPPTCCWWWRSPRVGAEAACHATTLPPAGPTAPLAAGGR